MRIVYASFSPGLRWNEQYAQEAVHTLVMLRWRLTLKWTTSPFLRVRTSWASPPSQARSSLAYSATPSSRVSRSPAHTFSSSSRLSPASTTYLPHLGPAASVRRPKGQPDVKGLTVTTGNIAGTLG